MKLRKANMFDILVYMLLLSLFVAFMSAFVYNNFLQEKRSVVVDYINKEVSVAQAKLRGYSEYEEFCYMYDANRKMSSNAVDNLIEHREARKIKNDVLDKLEKNVTDFLKANVKKDGKGFVVNEQSIKVSTEIIDSDERKDSAKIMITVQYDVTNKTPMMDENSSEDHLATSDGTNTVTITDTAIRAIENPYRTKNSNEKTGSAANRLTTKDEVKNSVN